MFYAKSKNKLGRQATVKEHLEAVMALSEKYGAEIGAPQSARLAAQMHDFGKYSEKFQAKLKGAAMPPIDHAICGASCLYKMANPKNEAARGKKYYPVMEAINGHHDGLTEISSIRQTLFENIHEDKEKEKANGKISALSGSEEYKKAFSAFQRDFPDFRPEINESSPAENMISMLYSRMLFSCLVDADYSASASDDNAEYLEKSEVTDFNCEEVLNSLLQYRDTLRRNSNSDSMLNRLRDEVFEACGLAGDSDRHLFTLTAPTGTGKTLALLNFALRHCISTGKKRIIIVLPFLTLTEQNAATYRKIYSQALEDHSQSDLKDYQRDFAARWSAPFIITTSVRFFESLFSNKPTDCRKLHNIANSVVVFDESQSLPAELTPATLKAVNELADRYNTTMVFSTATQPDYTAIRGSVWEPKEILPDNLKLYEALKRVEVAWKIENDEKMPLDGIAEEMAREKSVCTIVNLRAHARKLYDKLSMLCSDTEVFFLTTDLCTDHRRKIVEQIRDRLKNNLPCRLVATQCIEAGVDFDFDVLFRALAPLEAIVQAAGRCNRNGKAPGGKGKVTVFIPDEPEPLYPGGKNNSWYEYAAGKVKALSRKHPIDIHDPRHLRAYYRMLFQTSADRPIEKKALTEAIKKRSFEETCKEYRLINESGYRLIVPYPGSDSETYTGIVNQTIKTGLTPKLMRDAAGITVSVGYSYKNSMDEYAEPLKIRRNGTEYDSGFYILKPQYHNLYSLQSGLELPKKNIPDSNFSIV